MSFIRDFKNNFIGTEKGLTRIILINVIVFLLINLAGEAIRFSGGGVSPAYWFAIPGNTALAIRRLWSFITYMFLHQGLMHILFNMLWLYWLGKIFVEYVGSKRLVAVYLLGGLSGGILFTLASIIFPF